MEGAMDISLKDMIRRHDINSINEFIENGGDVNCVLSNGQSPLMYSIGSCEYGCESCGEDICRCNHVDYKIVSLLIKAGADVNVIYNDGTTLIRALDRRLGYKVINELLDAGADVNGVDNRRRYPLQYALQSKYDALVIKKLINLGAHVSYNDEDNRDLMCLAVHHDNCTEVFKMLIEAGADINTHGDDLLSLISCNNNSLDCKHKPMIELLLKNGFKIDENDCKLRIIESDCNYVLKVCFERGGISVDFIDDDGYTPLMLATVNRNDRRVKDLLQLFNADPNFSDVNLRTALHYAVDDSDPKCIALLLYHGADLFACDINGKTCLDEFFETVINAGFSYFNNGFKEIMKYIFLYINDYCFDDYFKHLNEDMIKKFLSHRGECKMEIIKMQDNFVSDYVSFYQFCINKRFYKSELIDISIDEIVPKYDELKKLFPIYQNFIRMRMKDNQKQLHKFRLLSYDCLGKINMRPSVVGPIIPDVDLIYDCRYLVSRYLNTKDIYNLFLASL